MTISKNNFKYSVLFQEELNNPLNDFEFAIKRTNTETQEELFCAIDEDILLENYEYKIVNLEDEIDEIARFIVDNPKDDYYSMAKLDLKAVCSLIERDNCEFALKETDVRTFFGESGYLVDNNKQEGAYQEILSEMFRIVSEENPNLVFE